MATLDVGARSGALTFPVLGIWGREALSTPYTFRVDLVVEEEGGIDPEVIDGMLGMPTSLAFGEGQTRSGILTELTLLAPDGDDRRTFYRAELRPRLVRTQLARGFRVYQNARVPALVAAILRRHGLELPEQFRVEVDPSHWAHRLDYVVQHDETDFAFVSRLMERWGLFYYFDEADGDRMVIGDSNAVFRALDEPLRFQPHQNADVEDDEVWGLSRTHRFLPRSLRLTDYNWRVASDSAQPSASVAIDERGHGEHHRYGGNLREPHVAQQLAKVYAESIAVDRETYTGFTRSPLVAPGAIFEIHDHPHPDVCRRYLVTTVDVEERPTEYLDRKQQAYVARFDAIPAEVPFRASQVTPWPSVPGLTHGFVDGLDLGAAAPVDETGSYRIRLPYDLAGAPKGKASRPIRKAEPASGPDHGVHLPLHVGCEVSIAYVHGDPDRPIVVGSVPNAAMPSPVRQADATKGRIRSRGGVEIQFDDAPKR